MLDTKLLNLLNKCIFEYKIYPFNNLTFEELYSRIDMREYPIKLVYDLGSNDLYIGIYEDLEIWTYTIANINISKDSELYSIFTEEIDKKFFDIDITFYLKILKRNLMISKL